MLCIIYLPWSRLPRRDAPGDVPPVWGRTGTMAADHGGQGGNVGQSISDLRISRFGKFGAWFLFPSLFFKAFFHMTCDGQGLQRLLAASEAGRVLEAGTRRRAGQRGSSEPRNRG